MKFIFRNNILDLSAVSSTDVKCYWNKTETAGKYKAMPLPEHNCFVAKSGSTIAPVKKLDSEAVLSLVVRAFPDSALAKHE